MDPKAACRRPVAAGLRRIGAKLGDGRALCQKSHAGGTGGDSEKHRRIRKEQPMNTLELWIHTSLAKTLALSLAHFVWEGACVAALLAIALRWARHATAQIRYGLACAA